MNALKITTRKPWTDSDVKELMSVYAGFLAAELSDRAYVKATAVRELAAKLERSKGSIEAKMMNVSAVLQDHGQPFVKGYKPLSNYSKSLIDQVSESIKLG